MEKSRIIIEIEDNNISLEYPYGCDGVLTVDMFLKLLIEYNRDHSQKFQTFVKLLIKKSRYYQKNNIDILK